MKKGIFVLSLFVLVFLGCTSIQTGSKASYAYNFKHSGNNFGSKRKQSYSIEGYNGTALNVHILSSLNGIKITSIGRRAFYDKKLTSVTISKNITSIGAAAFAYNKLTRVTIPANVLTIDGGAFSGNPVTSINVDPGNPNYTSIDGVLFSKDGTVLVCYPKNKGSSYVIPDRVKTIAEYAFAGSQLTSITIPASVNSIESRAFANNQLTSVTIPEGVNRIGNSTFANNQLTNVTIPEGVTSIGENAFANNQLTSITFPASITSIEKSAFANNQLTSVTIPAGVTSIGESAFANNQLTSFTIPTSVYSIYERAFANNKLTSVTIPRTVGIIRTGAFSGNNLTSVSFQDSSIFYDDYKVFGESLYTILEAYGPRAGTYLRRNNQWHFNGSALPQPARLNITSSTGVYVTSVDGIGFRDKVDPIIANDGLNRTQVAPARRRSAGSVYIAPGSRRISVGYYSLSGGKYTYSRGTVTLERIFEEGGVYNLTATVQGGDQIQYSINRQ